MDRRVFLTTGAQAAAAVAIAAAAVQAHGAEWPGAPHPAPAFTRARFEAWLNSSFSVRRIGSLRSRPATLIAIKDGPRCAGLDQFELVFSGEGPPMSGLCELEHSGGERLHLHLDAGRTERGSSLTRAAFSLIAKV
jgi:hypothetical protein